MALAQGHPVGQPLDIDSQSMLNSRLPICSKTFIGAVFVVNSLALYGGEIMGKSAATKTLLPTVGPASWLGVSSGMRSNELRNVRGRGRREQHAPKIYL